MNLNSIQDTIIYFSQASNLLRTSLNIREGAVIEKETRLTELVINQLELLPVFQKLDFPFERNKMKLKIVSERLKNDSYLKESERFRILTEIEGQNKLLKELTVCDVMYIIKYGRGMVDEQFKK
ncbi:MAG: hypothetical protein AABW90_01585 [Nanoarchaeota archaeon]